VHRRAEDLAAWLRARVTAAGARGLAVGLSGGVDSAVVARLAQIAVPDRAIGVILPCHSDPLDESDARLVADHFRLPTLRIDLGPAFDRLTRDLAAASAQLPTPANQRLSPPKSICARACRCRT
jgi:NAD+ synthase